MYIKIKIKLCMINYSSEFQIKYDNIQIGFDLISISLIFFYEFPSLYYNTIYFFFIRLIIN